MQNSEHTNKDLIVNSWDDLKFAIYLIHCLFRRAKSKFIKEFIEQRFAKMYMEANLKRTLMGSVSQSNAPVRLPFGIFDWQAEHLSLSHIGSFRVYLSSTSFHRKRVHLL